MTKPLNGPWTFAPFEVEPTQAWTVYDENLARIVAVFYDKSEVDDYLVWRNDRQKRLAAEKLGQATGDTDDFDDDGRC